MAVGDVKIKKDKTAVAIQRDVPDDSPILWGVMTIDNGGHYGDANEVADPDVWEDGEAVPPEDPPAGP